MSEKSFLFPAYHEAVLAGVVTGGKDYDVVGGGEGEAKVLHGSGRDVGGEDVVFFLVIVRDGVQRVAWVNVEVRNDVVLAYFVLVCNEKSGVTLYVIGIFCVIQEGAEHAVIKHVVTVKQVVAVGEV